MTEANPNQRNPEFSGKSDGVTGVDFEHQRIKLDYGGKHLTCPIRFSIRPGIRVTAERVAELEGTSYTVDYKDGKVEYRWIGDSKSLYSFKCDENGIPIECVDSLPRSGTARGFRF